MFSAHKAVCMQRWLLAKVVAMLSQSNLWDLCYLLLVAIICREAKVLTTVAIEQNAGYVYGDFCSSSAPDSIASALTHCRRRPRPLVDQPQRSAGSAQEHYSLCKQQISRGTVCT